MFRTLFSLNIILVLTSIFNGAIAQDSLILEEVQTFYMNGTIKSIEEYKFDKLGNVKRFSKYTSHDNSIYTHDTHYDSLNRPIREETIENTKLLKSPIYKYTQ